MSKVILIFNTLLAFTSPGVQGANTDSHSDKLGYYQLPRLAGIMFEFYDSSKRLQISGAKFTKGFKHT